MERSLTAAAVTAAQITGPVPAGWAVDWTKLDYRSAAALRAALTSRYAAATANRHLAAVRGVIRAAVLLGLMERGQAEAALAGLRTIRAETLPTGRTITAGEMATVFRLLADDHRLRARRDAAVLAVLHGTGMRRAEVVGLDLHDWHSASEELAVRSGKGRKERRAYAFGGVAAALAAWVRARGEQPGPLFVAVNKAGKVDPQLRRLRPHAINRIVNRALARAGLQDASPHDFRRTVATELLDDGADLSIVAGLLGHAQVTTTARYDRRPDHARRRAAERRATPYVPPKRGAGRQSLLDRQGADSP